MDNGPALAGFLIAVTLVWSAFYVGGWFNSAVTFSDAHSLDAAREARPTVCSFKTDELNGNMAGDLRMRDGIIHFDISEVSAGTRGYAVEIDMMHDGRMMTQARPGEDFQSLDAYPSLRVQVLEDLKKIVHSNNLHCAPWWSAHSFEFAFPSTAN